MMRHLLSILLLCCFAACAYGVQTKVATMHSQWGNSAYKSDQSQVLSALGWEEEQYENIDVERLVNNLPIYDMVILNGLFNYERVQDLAHYGPDFRKYIANGGCLLVTDANYVQQTTWLTSIDPELVWSLSHKVSETEFQPVALADDSHPLTAGAPLPKSSWTYPSTISPYLHVIYKNADGSPSVGVMEIGKGVVVVAGPYRHTSWPPAEFLRNLLNWTRDNARVEANARRENQAASQQVAIPSLTVPTLSKEPTIDGKIDSGEWEDAALISAFLDVHGRSDVAQPTTCRVARTTTNLYLQFECFDDNMDKLAQGITVRDGRTWDNDSVEIFLDPAGTRENYYQFAVSCSGAQYDGFGWDADWDSYWYAKTSIGEKSWVAEICIPLSVFSGVSFSETGQWSANFCRCARPSYSKELTSWSASGGVFHRPARFGNIGGMKVDENLVAVQYDLDVKLPQEWYIGTNNVGVALKKAASTPDAVLELVDTATGVVLDSRDVPAKAKPTSKYTFNITTDSPGQRVFQVVLRQKADNQVLAGGKLIKANTLPALTTEVMMPVLRSSIQSKDKIKRLEIDCLVGVGESKKLQLLLTGTDQSGKVVSTVRKAAKARKRVTISANAAKLPYGKYNFTLELLDDGRRVASQQFPLNVVPPAKTEVSFDNKRVCYVNGKPFFPIGIYHVSHTTTDLINEKSRLNNVPEVELYPTVKELRDRGFNAVTYNWGMPDEEFMEFTQSLGMWVIPENGVPKPEHVEFANRYDNVLMWYGLDEPSAEAIERIREDRDKTAELDPNRPVSAAICNFDLIKAGLAGFDFIMIDPYLIRHAPLAGIGKWVQSGLDASKGRRPVWMVPQAFTIDSPAWKEPTPEELRCQAYISLANGATGFVWYAYWSSERWSDNPVNRGIWVLSDSKLWDAFPKLNAEVEKLAPIVLTGKNLGPAKCSSKDVHTCRWSYKGKTYMIAVNTLYTSVKCKIEGVGDNVRHMFEERSVSVHNNSIEELFRPLQANIYVY